MRLSHRMPLCGIGRPRFLLLTRAHEALVSFFRAYENVLARKKRGAKVVKKLQVCKFLRTFAAKIAKGHERNTRIFDRIVIQQ